MLSFDWKQKAFAKPARGLALNALSGRSECASSGIKKSRQFEMERVRVSGTSINHTQLLRITVRMIEAINSHIDHCLWFIR